MDWEVSAGLLSPPQAERNKPPHLPNYKDSKQGSNRRVSRASKFYLVMEEGSDRNMGIM
jgi:hypothetical protein